MVGMGWDGGWKENRGRGEGYTGVYMDMDIVAAYRKK
jgi:hypothetical protein